MERDSCSDVRRSMAGDRVAFERLIDRYGGAILYFLLRMVGDLHASQDLAQETFMKAFASLRSLESPSRFRAWLFRIAFHVAVDFRRCRENAAVSLDRLAGRPPADTSDSVLVRLEEADERAMRYSSVVQALVTLPEHYGIVLVLRYLQSRSYKEMSRLLDLSLSNVKVRLHRARKLIRNRLTAQRAGATLVEERSS